jgi:hypothetical protein
VARHLQSAFLKGSGVQQFPPKARHSDRLRGGDAARQCVESVRP